MENTYRMGVDTGGTFTDLCVLDESSGRLAVTKVPSTPSNPALAVIAGIKKLIQSEGILPQRTRFLIHGTTVATNALLEHKGAKTALITTEGFEDVLHIGRQNRPKLYDFRARRPEPIVPRNLRYGVAERILYTGEVLRPLDESGAAATVKEIKEKGVESVAVSLIHSYANPIHENTIKSIIARHFPEAYVTVSAEVLPEFREYERTSTICINAYVMPKVNDYVADLERQLRRMDIASDLYIMQSNGGVITAKTARRMSARTVLSGPAGGALTGVFISRSVGRPKVITIDMGGTSSDICLIEGGRPRLTTESDIGGYPIKLPMIDINTIGAGGGSIAWIDAGGGLQVGPRSAGADPGPVCYGRGGMEPTVTDANAVLGRINPSYLLGGEMELHLDEAREVLEEKIARPLGMGLQEAAEGIISVVNANMIRGIRRVSVEKGYDPREFTLVPFGGAGPMHGVELARALNMKEVVIPAYPGIASAFGMLSADVRHDFVQTHICRTEAVDVGLLVSIFKEMEGRALEQLKREGFSGSSVLLMRSADMRYVRQAYELSVPVKGGSLGPRDVSRVVERFHGLHEKAYGYARRRESVEFVNLRVVALGKLPELCLTERTPPLRETAAPVDRRDVFFEGAAVETPVYLRDDLVQGQEISGPAVIEQMDSTILVPPQYQAVADRYGNLSIRMRGDK
ncbi:MAG: hydantoinase/oxoprolinase family protein [Deltaproteobacteria bacterium]|nr:hydantoinase/oxoprolinase family protein [Deltaproteobacteria bacterium]MBW2122172.1 hydantoinase/oxoprolinase family protein [Deltaproteobacteria bacterium]